MKIQHKTEDYEAMDTFFRRNFFNSLGGFKSVNLVGTIDKEDQTNLAIISSIVHIGATPPYIGMIMRPHSVPRHTLENILDREYYTINHIHQDILEQSHQTSARYDKEISEFNACGLTEEYSEAHPAPYVKESRIQIGLKFSEKMNISVNNTVMVIGQVIETRIPEEVVGEDGFIDIQKAGTVTVAGLDAYHSTSKIKRLSYAKPDRSLKAMESFTD